MKDCTSIVIVEANVIFPHVFTCTLRLCCALQNSGLSSWKIWSSLGDILSLSRNPFRESTCRSHTRFRNGRKETRWISAWTTASHNNAQERGDKSEASQRLHHRHQAQVFPSTYNHRTWCLRLDLSYRNVASERPHLRFRTSRTAPV